MKPNPSVDVQLLNAELYTEPNPAFPEKMDYFIKLIYRAETKARIEEVTFPKIRLPIYHERINFIEEHSGSSRFDGVRLPSHYTIDVGFGSTEILNGGEENCMVKREVIEEKIQDFTMEELEKLVSGKIRIVKEKPNGNS